MAETVRPRIGGALASSAMIGAALGGATSAWFRAMPLHIGSVVMGRVLVGAVTASCLVAGLVTGAVLGLWITERTRVAVVCLVLAWLLSAAVFPRDFEAWALAPLQEALDASLDGHHEVGLPWYVEATGRVGPLPLFVGVSLGLLARLGADATDASLRRMFLTLATGCVGAIGGHFAATLAMPIVGIRGAFHGSASLLIIAGILRSRTPSTVPPPTG